MKLFYTLCLSLFVLATASAQPPLNMSLVGQLDYNVAVTDIWGYEAPDDTEYALVCTQTGVSIVSLADPANPEELHFVQGVSSGWRDVKVWDHFAYVTNETGNGVAVIDLSGLPESIDSYDWTPSIDGLGTLISCHNIFIDEFGYAYLIGCNINGGGMLYIDVNSMPGTPLYVGKGPSVYSHDVYVRDNLAYSADINAGYFSIHDVTDKANSVLLATQDTPAEFTHNTWLSDDGTVLFTTDEVGDAPVASYEVSDPQNIQPLDEFRPFFNLDMGAIPHNVTVWDDFLIVSYYTEGCIVIDATHPDNLIQVGNFDTFLGGAGGFSGAWGAYPYLPSGLIIVSDRSDGLFVLQPNYVRACYLEGQITDAVTTAPLQDARVEFVDELPFAFSDLSGTYKTGFAVAGTYEVEVSKFGYESVEGTVTLENGEITIFNAALQPLPSISVSGLVTDADSGNPVEGALVSLSNEDITLEATTDASGNYTLDQVFFGNYDVVAGKWGYRTNLVGSQEVNESTGAVSVALEPGVEDIFLLDLGWEVTGNPPQGDLELAIPPIGVTVELPNGGLATVQPGEDSPNDEGNGCYFTGNISGLQNGVLIGGSSSLTSPVFDPTYLPNPAISFEYWFLNVTTGGDLPTPGNDNIIITINNGVQTKIVDLIPGTGLFEEQAWKNYTFAIADELEVTTNMQITFTVVGTGFGDISEGGIDNFHLTELVSAPRLDAEAFVLNAFPNPSTDQFRVNYEIDHWDGQAQLVVNNLLGQQLQSFSIDQPKGFVDLGHDLSQGVYFVQIRSGDKISESLKLIKQ